MPSVPFITARRHDVREVVSTSKELSIRLAEVTRSIRDRIKAALELETERADMYAQTIACSLLSARIVDPHRKTSDDFTARIRTNPFLGELLDAIPRSGGPGIDFDELGVAEVVDLLDNANMEAVVRDFAERNPLEDPVIHFYELFLKEYDPKKRMQRGVFYTPRPVVSYIVRSADELLRREFGLADGLADTSSWAEVVRRHEHLTIPEGVSPEQDFVQILDPAAGTGTFLVEAIDSIHRTLVAKWRSRGHGDAEIDALWNDYVPKHLLTRLHGYELLMAPYAIAHLKIRLRLHETGYRFGGNERGRVRLHLTNALERGHGTAHQRGRGVDRERGGEHERGIELAAERGIERDGRFTVILGNPPYANYSANLSAGARRIVDRYRTFNGAPIRERNQLQFERNIQDDFVKFMSFAQDRIEECGAGVVAYITNGTMLASPSLRGMRQSLMRDFNRLYELHLHGGANEIIAAERSRGGREKHEGRERREGRGNEGRERRERDENVFDIVQSVAIHLYARSNPGGASGVHYAELFGTRSTKYAALMTPPSASAPEPATAPGEWQLITPDAENCGFVPSDVRDAAPRNAHRRLDSAFVQFGAGIKTNRDAVVIGFDDASLLKSVRAFDRRLVSSGKAANDANDAKAAKAAKGAKGAKDAKDAKDTKDTKDASDKIHSLLYRPFDVRRIFFDEDAVASRSLPTMRHVLAGPNIGFVCSSTWTTPDRFTVGVSRLMVEMKTGTHDRGTTFFPLYRYEDSPELKNQKLHNLSSEFVKEWCDTTRTTFVPTGRGDGVRTTGPEDVFYFLFGLFHAPEYRRRYRAALSQGFPVALLSANLPFIRQLAGLGERLAALHLLESKTLSEPPCRFIGSARARVVTKVGWTPDHGGTVWIDGKGTARTFQRGTAGFAPVPEAVWTLHLAGYQVCEKWLRDRKGRPLSDDDISHYSKIVSALTETARLMRAIDGVVEQHGGWPRAFIPAPRGVQDLPPAAMNAR